MAPEAPVGVTVSRHVRANSCAHRGQGRAAGRGLTRGALSAGSRITTGGPLTVALPRWMCAIVMLVMSVGRGKRARLGRRVRE